MPASTSLARLLTAQSLRERAGDVSSVRSLVSQGDAIPIYLREAQSLIARTGRPAYEAAIIHLKTIKALHIRLGQPDVWSAQLASLRARHKAKRTLLPLLADL